MGKVMDDSYGNYALGSYGRATPTHHLHISDSRSKGPYQNLYRRGGGGSQQQKVQDSIEGRGNNQSGSSITKTWRVAGVPRPTTCPSRERLGGKSPTRPSRADARPASISSRGRGVANSRVGRSYVDKGLHVDRTHTQNCRAHHGHETCERGESPHRGDRPRWAVAEAPIVIGGQSMYLSPEEVDHQAQLEEFWANEQMYPESTPRVDSTFFNGRAESSSYALTQEDNGTSLHDATTRRGYGGDGDIFNSSCSLGEGKGEGSHAVRGGATTYRHEENAMRSRREWYGGGSSWGDFDHNRAGSSSGDSITPSESKGRPFSHRKTGGSGGKWEYHSRNAGEGSSTNGKGWHRDYHDPFPPPVEVDSAAGALWKAKKLQVPELVQELEEKLTKGTVECMICYDKVGRGSPVWSCASCYAIFHLSCIRKWARAPSSADMSISSSSQSFDGNWRCPGCQTVEFISAKDLRYYCFCGQVENPTFDHYITPHSCGGPCKKALDKSKVKRCNHYCTMQCHPGPCPPCAANAPNESCPCGKKTFTRRCGEQKAIGSCGDVCGRPLLCGRHFCSRICHEGPCDSCNVEVRTQCFCGMKQEILSCGRVEVQGQLDFEKGLFSCASPCSRMLSCGNHRCEEKCHPGKCGECELAPSKLLTCPCGKKLQELVGNGRGRKTCLDAVPTCSQSCGKRLSCGTHVCRELCHAGPCPPCKVPIDQKCRCGSTTRSVACFVSQGVELVGEENAGLFLCQKKCGQKKSCGRHRCNNRCCPAMGNGNNRQQGGRERDPHECLLSCGKKLRCKQHYCQDLCHSGHCAPCLESTFTELSCACGKTSIPPPVPCGTPLPACQQPCTFTQACGHSPTHLCHFGDCPPCTVQVSKECVGNHVLLRGVPCGSRDIKCNSLCGKSRQCGLHACGRACHVGPCDTLVDKDQGIAAKPTKLSCGQQCGAPRRDCPHKCGSNCHPLSLCPENRCKVMVKITCGCGRMSGEVPCDAGGSSIISRATAETEMVLSRLPAPLQPINGNEKIPLGKRKIQCDDECGKLEKRRVIADAFGVDFHDDDHPGIDDRILGYDMLAEMLQKDPQWVLSVEERFKTLLLGPKGVGGIKVHVFCAMTKEKRDIVTQLAERWSLSVRNGGREPYRFPIVHVTNKSKVPYLKLLSKTPLPTAGQQMPPAFNLAVDMEPELVIAFLDVPRDVDMSNLVLRFAGECELVWLNDKNALAIFGDAARAATALRRVDHTSTYKGAISLPGSAIHYSSRVGGAWGKTAGDAYISKPVARKKSLQQESSTWVEDAWGKAGKKATGAWQSKAANPITISKNPWGALEQSKPRVNELGIPKGCFVTGQSSQVPTKLESSDQGERARPPATAQDKQLGSSKEVALSLSKSATSNGSNATVVNDNDDDCWEKLLD